MKKSILIMTMALSVMLCACGGSSKKIEGEVQTSNEQTKDNTDVNQTGEEKAEHKGYTYIHDGVVVEIDAKAAPVIEQLGEAVSYFEAPSCAFEGVDKIYTYSSFELETYPVDGEDFVSCVTFKDDSITTLEGVGIGDSLDKVKEVYGTDATEDGGMLVYKKDDMKLCFIIQDDAVVSIEYLTTILDE